MTSRMPPPNIPMQRPPSSDVDLRTMLEAFDALPDATYLFDSDGFLIGLNKVALSLMGAQKQIVFGQSRCCDLFWKAEGADACIVERCFARGATVEVEISASTEKDLPMIVRAALSLDSRNHPTGNVIVSARDVSMLRRAEAEMLERRSFMATLVDATPDEIYSLDLNGRIRWMNKRAEAVNLSMPTGVLGRNFEDFVSPEFVETARKLFRQSAAGEAAEAELKTVRVNEEERWAEAHMTPLWREGEVNGLLVYLRDVTVRKMEHDKAAQADKLRAVGELAAGVAHNLNNSLTVIHARAQMLERKLADEAAKKSLKIITQAVSDGSQTLRRILEFARRDPNKGFSRVELKELVTSSVEIGKPRFVSEGEKREKGINISVVAPEPVFTLGDASELREVVLNLLFNAIDAMPQGGDIEIGTRAELDSVCFWVADNGTGMTEEQLGRIFEPFFTTKGEKGTGLGLSASQGIIHRHGGTIVAISEEGEGTRFEVRLPPDPGKQ